MRLKYIFYLLVLAMIVSCSREDEITPLEPEIITDPPVELEVGDINGIVKDINGDLLPDAKVQLFSEVELIAEITTNDDGSFNFRDVFIGLEYTILVEKESFHESIVLVIDDHFDNSNIEINLLDVVNFPFVTNDANPLDSNFVLVTGNVETSSGEPVEALIKAFDLVTSECYNVAFSLFGEFQMFLPRDIEVALMVQPLNCTVLTELVITDFNTSEEVVPTLIFDAEEESAEVSGKVLDCNSGNNIEGYLMVQGGISPPFRVDIVNGNYEFEVSGCALNFIYIEVFSFQDELLHTEYIQPENQLIELDILVCEFGNFDFGDLSLIINDVDSLNFNVAAIQIYDDMYIIFGQEMTNVGIQIRGQPNTEVEDIEFNLSYNGEYFFGSEELTMEFEIIESNSLYFTHRITGQVSGNLNNNYTNEPLSIFGYFDIPLFAY